MGAKGPTYILHLTLDTGHGRRSYRDEIDDGVVALVGQQIAEALAGVPVALRPGVTLTAVSAGGALLATIAHQTYGPLATAAVAESSLQATKVWEILKRPVAAGARALGDRPRPPWCAVRLYPGLNGALDLAEWIGDAGLCIAWAWLERAR